MCPTYFRLTFKLSLVTLDNEKSLSNIETLQKVRLQTYDCHLSSVANIKFKRVKIHKNHSMLEIFKRVIFFLVLFKLSEAGILSDIGGAIVDTIAPSRKCVSSDWTNWIEDGTCGRVTRKRSHEYYMCEY